MLKELIQGKPLGHPLHSALVHFPIGLFTLSLLLDIATRLAGDSNTLFRAAFYAITFGVIMALAAALPGFLDWTDIRGDHLAKKTATTHMLLNLTAVGLFLLNLILRFGQLEQDATPILNIVLSLVGLGMIFVSGYLGGTMVYDDGVGVGRHRRHTPMPDETIHVSSRDARGGYVTVADENQLPEGETLRVNWDGTVLVIARVGGQPYAFQEFCTHRYGPLSEGAFYDHQVECPWHRSCFDIRTGKVTEGPAKVDLKTFPVGIKDGKIVLQTAG